MKRLIVLILILLSFFFSCQNKEKEETLIDRAETLSVNYPDSAYILLDSIVMPEIMSDKLLARWCMLYARIANKLFKDMPYVS